MSYCIVNIDHRIVKLILATLCNLSLLIHSGETAFKTLSLPLGWAKLPMIQRIGDIEKELPITFIYGSRTWMDRECGNQSRYLRPDSRVDVEVNVPVLPVDIWHKHFKGCLQTSSICFFIQERIEPFYPLTFFSFFTGNIIRLIAVINPPPTHTHTHNRKLLWWL